MQKPAPVYTRENCDFAYQLDWGLSVFWRLEAEDEVWVSQLARGVEADGIRLLKHRFVKRGVSQFLLSSKPEVEPKKLVARIKGRLQHLLREWSPKALKRNYDLHSIGSSRRAEVERYVESQLDRYPLRDHALGEFLQRLQVRRPNVDLSEPQRTVRGIFRYNLHVVLETDGGWGETCEDRLTALRDMILRAARAKGHLLSRAGILPEHIHLTLGCPPEIAPADIALSYLNNLAHVYEMRPVFRYSAYLGTFGEYDVGTAGKRTPWPGAS